MKAKLGISYITKKQIERIRKKRSMLEIKIANSI